MIWAIVVLACAGADCRTVHELPLTASHTYQECEQLRSRVSFKNVEQLKPTERVKTECQWLRDRWSRGSRVVNL